MKIDIVDFAEQEGRKIANAILPKHSEYPHVVGKVKGKGVFGDLKQGFSEARETTKVEKEIADRALHEATAFFLKNSDMKFDGEVNNALIGHLSQKAKSLRHSKTYRLNSCLRVRFKTSRPIFFLKTMSLFLRIMYKSKL